MRNKLRKLYWLLLGIPDLPPKDFIVKFKINEYNGKIYAPRSNTMAQLYVAGRSVEDIAAIYNVTRERIRQCIWKAYRESLK